MRTTHKICNPIICSVLCVYTVRVLPFREECNCYPHGVPFARHTILNACSFMAKAPLRTFPAHDLLVARSLARIYILSSIETGERNSSSIYGLGWGNKSVQIKYTHTHLIHWKRASRIIHICDLKQLVRTLVKLDAKSRAFWSA